MSALTNAPVGAMQFAVSPLCANVYKRTPVVWILPPVPRVDYSRAGCTCAVVYPVIEEAIPAEHQPALESQRQSRNPSQRFFVCNCMGKVIE